MDLRQLESFVRVAELGSFSRAAAVANTGQPALSRAIRGLETEVGRALFHRNGRGVTLTDAGARLLDHAKGILHQLEGARSALRGADEVVAGKIVIGLPPSVGRVATVALVRSFRERFPNAQLAIVEGLTVPLQERLLAGHIDVGVFHNPAPSPLLAIEPLLSEALWLLSARQRGLPRRVAFRTLEGLGLIFPAAPHPIRSLVETEAARRGVRLTIAMEIDALSSMLQLVSEGYGHAVVPHTVSSAGLLGNRALVARQIERPALASLVALVTPARRPMTVLAQKTMELLREVVAASFSGREGPAPRTRRA
ncbi:MAG TPA: LysR substrate-binding domain-containing protein [Alphaproteobacteria bacterium]|nr:LysR substrate-binding domain-containing protein [Alphaproteobacteria bacterium]